jgi:hypothetical protein
MLCHADIGRSKREQELTHANAFVCRDYHSSCQNAQHQWQISSTMFLVDKKPPLACFVIGILSSRSF